MSITDTSIDTDDRTTTVPDYDIDDIDTKVGEWSGDGSSASGGDQQIRPGTMTSETGSDSDYQDTDSDGSLSGDDIQGYDQDSSPPTLDAAMSTDGGSMREYANPT